MKVRKTTGTKRPKRRTRYLGALCTCAAAGILLAANTNAVDNNAIFELEGDFVDDTAIAGDDWSKVVSTGGSSIKHTPLVADPTGAGDDILTGGHSKDIYDFSQWLWKQTSTTSVQDKDDIANVAAAAYTLPNGDTAVYFMADRFDNSGDSQMGFWFVADSTVGPTPDGKFAGHHTDGDFLVVAHFVTGGSAPEIEVFRWTGGANGSLGDPIVPSNTQKCDPSTGVKTVCAIVNAGTVDAPAGFKDKSGNTSYAHGEFMEGGINLNAIFGANVPCIASFFAETRSSQSTTATLSDFTVPVPFQLCGMTINKTCDCVTILDNGIGGNYQYSVDGKVKNVGIGNLYNVTVTDKSLTFSCSTLAPGAEKKWGTSAGTGDCTGTSNTFNSTDKPATNTAHAAGTTNSSGGTTVTADTTPLTTCSTTAAACNPTPGFAPAKNCTVDLDVVGGQVVVRVSFSGSVLNNESLALLDVSVQEDNNNDGTRDGYVQLKKGGVNCGTPAAASGCTLLPSETVTFSGNYIPDRFTALGPFQGKASFTDKIFVNAKRADTNAALPEDSKTATCVVCPQGSCPASP